MLEPEHISGDYCRYRIGPAIIEVWPQASHMRHTFPDGARLEACPSGSDEEARMMRELGYSDPVLMCFEHEALHHIVAIIQGRPCSDALWHAARGRSDYSDAMYEEESAVLSIQRALCEVRRLIQ